MFANRSDNRDWLHHFFDKKRNDIHMPSNQEDPSTEEYLPLISVLFITYNRLDLLQKTLDCFLKNTTYPRNRLQLIVCDDASPRFVQEEIRKMPFDIFLCSLVNRGLGANTNQGLAAATGDFIFQLQDDWLIEQPSDYLEQGVWALRRFEHLQFIRYTVKGTYDYFPVLNYEDNRHQKKNIQFFCKRQSDVAFSFLIYSDQPHLKKASFHRQIGPYAEGINMEDTEVDMSRRFLKSTAEAAVLLQYEDVFRHVGAEHSFRTLSLKDRLADLLNRTPILSRFFSIYTETKAKIRHHLFWKQD